MFHQEVAGVGAIQSSAPHESFVVGGAGEGVLVGMIIWVNVTDNTPIPNHVSEFWIHALRRSNTRVRHR